MFGIQWELWLKISTYLSVERTKKQKKKEKKKKRDIHRIVTTAGQPLSLFIIYKHLFTKEIVITNQVV